MGSSCDDVLVAGGGWQVYSLSFGGDDVTVVVGGSWRVYSLVWGGDVVLHRSSLATPNAAKSLCSHLGGVEARVESEFGLATVVLTLHALIDLLLCVDAELLVSLRALIVLLNHVAALARS